MKPEYYVFTVHGEVRHISAYKKDLENMVNSWTPDPSYKIEGPFHLVRVNLE